MEAEQVDRMSRQRMQELGDVAVTALAVARLTRFVTTDKLGDDLLVKPAKRWAHGHEPEVIGWRTKLADSLDCPFCIGFWIGLGVLAVPLPRVLKQALALNYVVGHVSRRLD